MTLRQSRAPARDRVRLQKYLAGCGVCSRREAEAWIAQGRVTVNGTPVPVGTSIDPAHDKVHVDGSPVHRPDPIYILLNKPVSVMSTRDDPRGRRTVIDLLGPLGAQTYLFPVGRLDYDSEGLLLLTNDGELTNRLLHPRFEVAKTYRVLVERALEAKAIERLRRGVRLEDGPTRPCQVRALPGPRAAPWYEVTITEGRQRQVRRMFQAVGARVARLIRIRMGPFHLAGLKSGHYRRIRAQEIERLLKEAHARHPVHA